MIRILITGSGGFVGSNLISYLSNDPDKVIGIIERNRLYNPELLNFINTDVVIHLAGKAHDLKKVSQPDEYYQINFELTKNVYSAFLKSKAAKFIFISSVKAVADSINEPLTEEYQPNPITHYGKSKLKAEKYILNQPLIRGKSCYILRPCMIHGPGNKGNLNLLYNFVSKGLPYPLAAFKNKRSYLSVDNLCFIIKELLEQDNIPSGIYNVSDDEALSTTEVVSLLSEALGKSPKLLNIPKKLISFAAKIGDILKLPLNTERLEKLTENYEVSNQKIKKILKKELPLTSREGILKTAHSFTNC